MERGLLIGDMSQPRDGPMLYGHSSHQIGLDVDITPMKTSAWDYVSGSLSRNDIRAIAAWDCVNRPMSWGLYNVALRLSRAYEGQHRR
jgi:murein endopeptidase